MPEWSRRTAFAGLATLLAATALAAAPAYTEVQRRLVADADAAYDRGDSVSALPLYEQLAAELPESPYLAERLAMCLLVKFENLPADAERAAVIDRARREANRARALGDRSDLVAMILERVGDPRVGENTRSARMSAAEVAFSRGDFDTALAGYIEIAAGDPRDYEARVFAGDVNFRKGDWALAGEWFQKAIDIDPNREVAYRYWGDALLKSGQTEDALGKMIGAVIAEPYSKRSWAGLHNWATATKTELGEPKISVPSVADKPVGGASIEIDAKLLKGDAAAAAAWLGYVVMRRMWHEKLFAQAYPDEKEYRHSLAEEVASLKAALTLLDSKAVPNAKADASVLTLIRLGHDGLLEPYVLLSAADQGIARDYAGYREQHRAELQRYLERYIARRSTAGGSN